MAESTRVTVTWVDAFLRKVRTVSYFANTVLNPAIATITGFVAVLQAISKAYPAQIATSIGLSASGSAATGAYANAEDKLMFSAKDVGGSAMNYKIAGPIAAAFLADTTSLNPGNAEVIALALAIDTYAVTQAGTAVVSNAGFGKRLRIKQLKH